MPPIQDVSIEDCCVWANCLRTNWWQSDWSLHLGHFAVAIINGLQCLSHRWLVIYPQCYCIFPLFFFTIYTVIWPLSHVLRLVSHVEQGLNTLVGASGSFHLVYVSVLVFCVCSCCSQFSLYPNLSFHIDLWTFGDVLQYSSFLQNYHTIYFTGHDVFI